MRQIGELIREKNIALATTDPVACGGFTQVPNFILKDAALSVGAKITYAMFLSYAWNNDSCFPGQERLAEDMGLTRVRVTQLIGELEAAGLVSIQRRGQGKTNLYTIHFRVKNAGSSYPQPTSRRKLAYSRR
jgi:biotin operon repressor